jgi:large conductance mechanosensitive channel
VLKYLALVLVCESKPEVVFLSLSKNLTIPMKKIFDEFKEFAVKGNMIEIAIGVIIGTAFNKVVDTIVKQIFLPPLSLITNGVSMENKKIVLKEAIITEGVIQAEEIAVGYGRLIEVSIDFLIVSLVVFIVVKFMNRLKFRAQDVSDSTVVTPKDIELLNRMTQLLEEQNKLLGGKKP